MAIDREKVFAAAQKYVEKKRYDKAVLEYQKVIQADPNDARTLLKIGDLQSKMSAFAEAVETYEKVGKFYAKQGFALKAIAVYKQIREIIAKHVPQLEDKYAHITPQLAELYQQLGLTSDALAALDEVATRLQRQNRDADAIVVFRKIVELDPTNPLPHLRLAEALSRAKDGEGAVAEFATAAGQLTKLGRRDDTIKVLERLLQHRPDPTHARTCAELYLSRNNPNDGMQALAKLQVCFQADPRNLDTLGLLAKAFTTLGQAAKAVEVYKETARIAKEAGKTEVFRDVLTKLQKLAPNDATTIELGGGARPQPQPQPRESAPMPQARTAARAPAPPPEPEDLADDEVEEALDTFASARAPLPREPEPPPELEPRESAHPIELSRRSRPPLADAGPLPREGRDSEAVIEASYEVVEEAPAPTSEDEQEQVANVLAEAMGFRRARLYGKAILTLQLGLEAAPRSIDLHEALRDALLEAGRGREAVEIMLSLAGIQIDGLDGETAARTLQDVLQLDPSSAQAMQMLRDLGYELFAEPAPPPSSAQQGPPSMRPEYTSSSSYDPEAPLPSYDLEEVGPEDVAARSYSEPAVRAAPTVQPTSMRPAMDDIDDPFAEPTADREALPPPPESAAAFDLVADRPGVARRPSSLPSAAPMELESALEEAEFFASRGLFEDARGILEEQLARLPKNPLVLERMAEIEAQERVAAGGSGARPSPGKVEDRSFDIAASLGEGDRQSAPGPVARGFAAPAQQVDVEEVFAKFKEGVAKQIGADDGQSHYDLAIAYKEMGLLDDAIREFDTAAHDPKTACMCHYMSGSIHVERGNLDEAIAAFMRGVQAPNRTKEEETTLSYEIGSAYDAKKMPKQALEYFQRCARLAPTFRDVQERIRRLTKADAKPPPRAAAVGADDEFDRAFDDLLGGGKG